MFAAGKTRKPKGTIFLFLVRPVEAERKPSVRTIPARRSRK
jgi:hypothetical protein